MLRLSVVFWLKTFSLVQLRMIRLQLTRDIGLQNLTELNILMIIEYFKKRNRK